MYKTGDIIIYTTYGVCKVDDVVAETFAGETKNYYILKPLNDSKSSIKVQTDNPIVVSKLRDLLNPEDIFELIHQIPFVETYWIDNENERKRVFSNILRSGSRTEIIQVVKSIDAHQKRLKEKNRKLHACDEQSLKDGLKLILDEFSFVLGIPKNEILNFVINEITTEE